jgi:hypothetical protein
MNGPENKRIRAVNPSIYPLEPKFFNVRGPKPLEFLLQKVEIKFFLHRFRVWSSQNDAPTRKRGRKNDYPMRASTLFSLFFGADGSKLDILILF